jgi:O-antigen/teichoic acid export membrane protein
LFFKDSIHTLVIRVSGYLIALTVQILIARYLGAGAKGELQIIMFLMNLVTLIVGLGFERAIIYHVGNKIYDLRQVWSNAGTFLLTTSILAFLIICPILYLTRSFFGEVHFGLLILIFLIVPLERLFSFQLGVFNGQGLIRKGNLFTLAQSGFYVILVVIFIAVLMPSSQGILYAYILAYLFAVLLVLFYFRRKFDLSLSFGFKRDIMKTCLRYGTKGQLGNILNLISTRVDLIILNFYLGKSLAGVYSVAINFADLLLFFPLILSYVIFPHAARRQLEEGWRLTQRVTRISFCISILLAVSIAVLAPLVIPVLFGEGFSGAVGPLWILLPGVILLSTFRVLASGISGLGYPFIFSICTIVTVISTVTLNLILVPIHKEIGAAISSAISYSLGFTAILIIIKFKFKHRLKDFLIPTKEDFIITRDNLMKIFKH